MSGDHTTTDEERDALAQEVRQLIASRTCCGSTAADVALTVMSGFCLDYFDDNAHQAAAALLKAARHQAQNIRQGKVRVIRVRQ